MEVRQFCEACFTRVSDDEFCAFGEGFFEAGRSDRVALGHVGADGEDGIGLVHVLERIGHCASSDLSGQTGHGRSVSSSRAVVYMVRAEARSDKLLHGVGRSVWGATRGDSVDGVTAVFCASIGEAFGSGLERGVPIDFFK